MISYSIAHLCGDHALRVEVNLGPLSFRRFETLPLGDDVYWTVPPQVFWQVVQSASDTALRHIGSDFVRSAKTSGAVSDA